MIRIHQIPSRRTLLIACIAALPLVASAATATLRPSKDTTIYGNGDADLSDGHGGFLFAGSSGPTGGARVLRSLMAFNLSGQVPAGATINSVTLTLGINTPIGGNSNTVQLKRLLADWGEGSSVANGTGGGGGGGNGAPATSGDATWNSRFFGTSSNWATPGGDFSSTVSASQVVRGSNGTVSFSGAGMVADVQAWVNNSATNFGWILMAQDETGPAVRFASRESSPAPVLTIDYTAGTGPANTAPTFTTQPASQTVTAGANVTFTAAASGTPAPTFQWRKDNQPIQGATSATLTLNAVTAANAGAYTVVATNVVTSVTSNIATLTVNPPDTGGGGGTVTARLSNLSILTSVASAGDSFTMGYVVGGGAGSKQILIRAAGPTLGATPFNIPGVLADPRLELFAGSTKSGENDNWGGTAALSAAFAAVGAFPYVSATSLDAAALATVSAGDNSVRVSATGNGTGTVIAELYDSSSITSSAALSPRLVNVSVLKHLGTGLTVGFVIDGSGTKRVLVRAVGPTIGAAPFNVAGAVADPQLTLFSGQTVIGTNDNWGGTAALSAAFTQVGAFALPAGSRDAAILATLNPGSYTVQVSGVGGTTGVAIVEIYEVP